MAPKTEWRSKLPQVTRKIRHDLAEIHDRTFEESRSSIVEGSTLTGAPGQPGDLRDKFKVVKESDKSTALGIDDPSAQAIETGISRFNGAPVTLHSPIGGFHSIALTQLAADRIVKKVVGEVAK